MKKKNSLFKVGIIDETTTKQKIIVGISGFLFLLLFWEILTFPVERKQEMEIWDKGVFIEKKLVTYKEGLFVDQITLPSPQAIFRAYPKLLRDQNLMGNLGKSVVLNLSGYIEAIIISLALGFLMGLVPFFRHLISPYVKVLRYLPLIAAGPIFLAWFGIGFWMKMNFLAIGIVVYLLPTVFQRVEELLKVHEDTLWTMGANKWQTFKHDYFPGVMSVLWKDIAVLTAISWTYITFAEAQNARQGGLGVMIFGAQRGEIANVYALLFLIMFFGFLQDMLFLWSDQMMFRHKYHDSK
jgi:NitT/TauT family transport system permease protein